MRVEEPKSSRRRNLIISVATVLAAILSPFFAGPKINLNFLDSTSPPPDGDDVFTLLNKKQLAEYKRSGFVIVRSLIPPSNKDALINAGRNFFHSRSLLDILFKASFAKLGVQIWRYDQQFAETALKGALPAISAQLLSLDDKDLESVRLLKDGFFGFSSKNNTGCGFHQDDRFFWPSTDDTTGVNFWIALSKISAEGGGGIRVVNRSKLNRLIAERCLEVIRPSNASTTYAQTCQMEELDPSCHEQLMKASVVHDFAPGDALIWDRRTFHRSEPFRAQDEEPKLRYTVRYVPDGSIAEGTLHPSVEQGQTFDTPYHPQVWPSILPRERREIEKGLQSDLPMMPILYRKVKMLLLG